MAQRMKTELIFIGAAVALAGVVICLTLYFNLASREDAMAAGSSYSSSATGSWTAGSTWSGGTAPSTSLNGDAITVNTNHTVTLTGNLSAQNNTSFLIQSNATLRIEGDFTVQNNLVLTVNGTLIVTGKIDIKNGANIDINGGGVVTTGGNVEIDNNANVTVDGTLNVGGDLTFGSNPVFNGSGNVNISGNGCDNWSGAGTCNENITLPIELANFEAVASAGNTVMIQWRTASELNNQLFTIERSSNGRDYEALTSVEGQGTTKQATDYEYVDVNPLNGISYYRLSQTDFDGTTTTFKPVSIKLELKASPSFSVYPNPLTGSTLYVDFSAPQEATIQVIDASGNIVLSEDIDESTSNAALTMNDNATPGFYYVNYITSAERKSMKIVKH